MKQHNKNQTDNTAANFHGAALIDEQGQEIPMTEDMIEQALSELMTNDPQDGH